MDITLIKHRLLQSKLFKDSFWAVFGNGLGNALLLLAGILIARFLGKDLYGEYGVVKTTMFYIATFATFGLGYTSTKYIAQYKEIDTSRIHKLVKDSLNITLYFSSFLAVSLIIFSGILANYLNEPNLKLAFQFLGCVIIFKALTTTSIGILAGFKEFSITAKNSVMSGMFMILLCIPLTYFYGLTGSLISLLFSQVFNTLINLLAIKKLLKSYPKGESASFKFELIKFSLPVALQESSFTICNWIAILVLTKMSSTGELGVYTAASQWNSIITFVPALLSNVVLSHLSSSSVSKYQNQKTMKLMLVINFTTTFIPFVIVYALAGFISSFYGETFVGLSSVMQILTFTTIFESCSTVFKSEFIAINKAWCVFFLRFVRDIFLVVLIVVLLKLNTGENGAILYSYAVLTVSILFLTTITILYLKYAKQYKTNNKG